MKKSYVIEHFKGPSRAAIVLGISQAAVSQWRDLIPEKQAMRLERITEGTLKYNPALYDEAKASRKKSVLLQRRKYDRRKP